MTDFNDARLLAKMCGEKTYTGKPCKSCGSDTRYSNCNGCADCARFRYKKRYHNDEGYKQRQLTRQKQPEYIRKQEAYYNKRYNSERGRNIHNIIHNHWYRAEALDAIPKNVNKDELFEYMVYLLKVCDTIEKNTGVRYSIDHIVPLSAGGSHCIANLQLLPLSDNIKKRANVPKQFKEIEINLDKYSPRKLNEKGIIHGKTI